MEYSPLKHQLSTYSVSLESQVYSAPTVKVYKGHYCGYDAAVKLIQFQADSDQDRLNREWNTLKALQHEHILKLYNVFWLTVGTQYFLCLVLEWCEKDFLKDLTQRKQHQFPYTELQLWTYLRQAVAALAFMQSQSIVHRDIKPQNLFLTSDSSLKVGDFGCAKVIDTELRLSVAGTPFFLSPILKSALLSRISRCVHNPFKSDTYSLGVTFVMMMNLEPMLPFVATKGDISDAIRQSLSNTAYSDTLKNCVVWMCAYNEQERCDFLELHNYLNPLDTQYQRPTEEEKLEEQVELQQSSYVENQEAPEFPLCDYEIISNGDDGDVLCNICSVVKPEEPDRWSELHRENKDSLWYCPKCHSLKEFSTPG